ncbi:MAG: fumarylacetoacetase [Phycisphaerales bacterium]|nr:fumarylacetoacetase [Phycisphaerales bacterium]
MNERTRSWIESAGDPDSDFPIENLPFGVFDRDDAEAPRIGVPIGDQVLDLREAWVHGLLGGLSGTLGRTLEASTLNGVASLGRSATRELRTVLTELFSNDSSPLRTSNERDRILLPASAIGAGLPFSIGDYTDFYASEHHATNVGRMFRPDGDPLLPNWKHLPVGYHGRASSVVESGRPIRRPSGQTVGPDGPPPKHGPCRLLDYELEVGFFLGRNSELGTPIPIEQALDHVFGLVLVNDWSARDVQKWEYQPLGPFNAKNFGTSISPWVVTLDALEPFMVPGPPRKSDDPVNLPYLTSDQDVAIDLQLEVLIQSEAMRTRGLAPHRISIGNYRDMYWTIAQMIAHHTSTGCDLRSGDMMASGTVSGPDEENRGCLLERTWRGENPISLPDGTERRFLMDGDEVIIRGWCQKDDLRIGFGECRGIITPALG